MIKPAPPPEAVIIRVAREAGQIKTPVAARAAGISVARWSQIEIGYETRRGRFKEVRARAGTLAHMAAAVGVSPDRLEEAGRGDAAVILREIMRRNAEPTPAPRYSNPGIERIANDPDLPDDVKAGLIAVAKSLMSKNAVSYQDERRRA